MIKLLLSGTAVLILLCGCAGENNASEMKKEQRIQNVGNPAKNREQQQYVKEDIMYTNPNFLDTNRENTGKSFANDKDKVVEVVNGTKRFEAGQILIRGNKMDITAYSKENLDGAEVVKAERELKRKLIAAIPTYVFNVKVESK